MVEKFLYFLEYRNAWQLESMGVTADEIADVYARVKKHGRMGVDHAAWMKGAKFLHSLTPHEVTDFQQMCLTTDVETRRAAFREALTPVGRGACRKRGVGRGAWRRVGR